MAQSKLKVVGLAIDASMGSISVGLGDGENILQQDVLEQPHGHAASLMPMILNLLKRENLEIKDLSFLTVITGPGSFTGVRVALAAAIGLAMSQGIALYGITGTRVLGLHSTENKNTAVVIDSRTANLCVQIFDADKKALTDVISVTADRACAFIKEHAAEIVIGQRLNELVGLNGITKKEISTMPLETMLQIAYGRFKNGEREETWPSALYVREPDVSVPKTK